MNFPFSQEDSSALDTNLFQSEISSNPLSSAAPQHQSAQTQLVIVNTKTYSQETLSVTGIPQLIHVVIKNSPFYLSIVQQPMNLKGDSQLLDLNQVTFESTLIYDDIGNGSVDYIKTKPVETKFEPSPEGDKMQVECRIKVLSSKHKDMFFRVRLEGFYPGTKNAIPGLFVTSGVIKVISKPEGKKKNESGGTTTHQEPLLSQLSSSSNNSSSNLNSSSSKKKSTTESLVDVVSRLEKQQQTQEQIIKRLLESQESKGKELRDLLSEEKVVNKRQKQERGDQSTSAQNPLEETDSRGQGQNQQERDHNNNNNEEEEEQEDNEEEEEEEEEDLTFEDAFRRLIESYNSMMPEEKLEVIRKLVRNSSFRELERVTELLDLFWSSGLEKPALNTANTPTEEDCSCLDCPHKEELEKIDSWYREFLSAPSFQ